MVESTVTLLRHGESMASAAGLVSTAIPGQGLTGVGHGQAQRAATGLATRGFDAIYSSPLARARETADAFALLTGASVTTLDGLAEVTAGDYEGEPASAVAEPFRAVLDEWVRGALDVRVPGGESGAEFLARMDAALAQITAVASTSLVVSHGEAIRCWATLRVPVPNADDLQLGYTGYLTLGRNYGQWQLLESMPSGW